jgi:hypothetical protein
MRSRAAFKRKIWPMSRSGGTSSRSAIELPKRSTGSCCISCSRSAFSWFSPTWRAMSVSLLMTSEN